MPYPRQPVQPHPDNNNLGPTTIGGKTLQSLPPFIFTNALNATHTPIRHRLNRQVSPASPKWQYRIESVAIRQRHDAKKNRHGVWYMVKQQRTDTGGQ